MAIIPREFSEFPENIQRGKVRSSLPGFLQSDMDTDAAFEVRPDYGMPEFRIHDPKPTDITVPLKSRYHYLPTLEELKELDKAGQVFHPDGRPINPAWITPEFLQWRARQQAWKLPYKATPAELVVTSLAEGAKEARFRIERDLQLGGVLPNPFNKDMESREKFRQALIDAGKTGYMGASSQEVSAAEVRDLGHFEKRQLFDETFERWWGVRGGAELAFELLVPGFAIEKIGASILGVAGRPLLKGGKKFISGIGEVVEYLRVPEVKEVYARVPEPKSLPDGEISKIIEVNKTLNETLELEKVTLRGRGGIDETGIDPVLEMVEKRIGKPKPEWNATDIRRAEDEINEVMDRLSKNTEEMEEELLTRAEVHTEIIVTAETGKHFFGYFFNGSGRQTIQEAYDTRGIQKAVLGDATYTTPKKEFAEFFGPNVVLKRVSLRNPLVISTDAEWMKVINEAKLFSHVPQNGNEIAALRKIIIDAGHDGVIVKVPTDEMDGKRLQQIFEDDTIIDFGQNASAYSLAPRIMDEIPVTGSTTILRLSRRLDLPIEDVTETVRVLEEENLIQRNTDGSHTKSQAKVPEPEAQIVPEPTAAARAVPQAEYYESFTKAGKATHLTGTLGSRGEPVMVSIEDLKNIPGAKGEEKFIDSEYSQRNIEDIAESMRQEGVLERIMIFIEKDGSVTIGEGNHRIQAAKLAGITEIPAEIKWFGNSNKDPNVWGRTYIDKIGRGTDSATTGPARRTPEVVNEDPPGVSKKASDEAADHPVNNVTPQPARATVNAQRSLPEPKDVEIPPDYRSPIDEMLAEEGPRESFSQWWHGKHRRLGELMNDMYIGLRKTQRIAQKERPVVKTDEELATGDYLDSNRDLTTMLTNAPGAAAAAQARFVSIVNEIVAISNKIMPGDVNAMLVALRQKEMLGLYPKRRLPNGITIDDIDQHIAFTKSRLSPERYSELEEAVQVILRVYKEERERLVNTGVISRKVADHLAEKHPYYNPTRYVEYAIREVGRGASYKPFTVPSNGVIKLSQEGTEKAVQAPLEILAEQLIRNEATIIRNDIAKTIIKLAQDANTPGVRRIHFPKEKVGTRPTIQFFENGKRIIYEVPDWMHRETDYMIRGWGTDPVSKLVGTVNGISRAAFTTVSPVFIPVNITADILTAYATRGLLPHRTAARLLKSVIFIKNDAVAIAHKMAGGHQARFYGKDGRSLGQSVGIMPGMSDDAIQKTLDKKLGNKFIYNNKPIGKTSFLSKVKNATNVIDTAGELAEQAPRQAFFKRELDKVLGKGWEKKWTPEQIAAMPVARKIAAESIELTLNFARGGYLIKSVNPFVIFLNASMEGMKLPMRAFRNDPVGFSIRMLGVVGGQIGLNMYNMSYPEYYDIPRKDRWGSVIIMLPHKEKDITGRPKPHYVSLFPATREWMMFLGTTTFLMEQQKSDSPEGFADFGWAMAEGVTPFFDMPLPVVAEEALQQVGNFDLFRDSPIVPPELEAEESRKQIMPWTSRTMKEIGEATGLSPIRTEHGFKSTLGGAYQVGVSITDYIINMIDPDLVTPEIAALVARYEDFDNSTDRKNWIAGLSAAERDTLFFELKKPEPTIPGVGPIIKRFYREGGGGAQRKAWEEEAQKVTGIDPKQTRDVYTILQNTGDRHLTMQQHLDNRVLSLDPEFGVRQWVSGRGNIGNLYQGNLEATAKKYSGAAQHADPKVRQQYYKMIIELGGNATDEYMRAKTLSSGWYSISMQQPSTSVSEDPQYPDSRTLIPTPEDWELFNQKRDEYMNALSEEDRQILEREITAGYTPLERAYHEDRKIIDEYYDLAGKLLKPGGQITIGNETLSLHDLLKDDYPGDKLWEKYNTYKRTSDREGARREYADMAVVDNIISRLLSFKRSDSYEMEKVLFKWGIITSPKHPALIKEVEDLRAKYGGIIPNSLLIDIEMIREIKPELLFPQQNPRFQIGMAGAVR